MADNRPPAGISRRSFVKYAAFGGLAAVGAVAAWRYPTGWDKWMTYGRKPWELDLGVVDYDYVLKNGWGPSALGFSNDIRNSPPSARSLNVAQWYDYWPGKILLDFSDYMQSKWGVGGVSVSWTSNIYTSNEELFTWVSQTGRKFDVMFPTNYTVETMEKAGLVVNMNRDWLPNYVNIFGPVPSTLPPRRDQAYEDTHPWAPKLVVPDYPTWPNNYNNEAGVDFRTPALNGYAYRMNQDTYPTPRGTDQITWNEQNSLLAIPYQWGTTGIGYRTDIFDRADIEAMGWEVFELDSYKGRSLIGKKMMLDDMREVYTAALKEAGWKKQIGFREQGLTTADPTNVTWNTAPTAPPGSTPATYGDAPFGGEYQWSSNQYPDKRLQDDVRLQDATDWLMSFVPETWGFNTPQQGPWLVSGQMFLDQAWSGDIMYAVRPNSNQHLPVDYFVPKQGGARWIDNATIHRECEKLWLAHEFINFICDPKVGATISAWNLYAAPNAWSFELLHDDPAYTFSGQNPDGSEYVWNPATDKRIYADIAIGYTGDPILSRCEYQKDVGVRSTLKFFQYWRNVKF